MLYLYMSILTLIKLSHMKKSMISLFIIAIAAIVLSGCDCQKSVTPEEAKEIAREAYIYGFPMVVNYKAMSAYVLDESSPEYKCAFNEVGCEARVYGPDDKAVVTPNSDTPYCMMWCDISEEPVVITVPEMEEERFYHFQLVDLFTHNFAYVGTLTSGNEAGHFMIADPTWQGDQPEYIEDIIRCETPLFFIVVRTQLFGTEDLGSVKNLQDAYRIQTLSEYMGGEVIPRGNTVNVPEWNEGDQFTAASFVYLDALLDMMEPVSEEKELWERFAKIDIGPGKTFDMEAFDPEIQEAVNEGIHEGMTEIETFLAGINSDPLASAKIFGTREFMKQTAKEEYGQSNHYLPRAAAAHLGLYGNSGSEAIYPVYLLDSENEALNAAKNKYTLAFLPGKFPPVKAFWSLTMYDAKTQLLIKNPLDRYLLNSPMMDQFVLGDDGSLTIYIQKDSPGGELEANWLPAPDGPFYMVMRLYGPAEAALEGDWVNPPVIKE